MHPEMIKASLRIAKTSPSFIAVEQGVTRQMVSNVICGRSRSARIEERISQILGKPVEEIWPDRPEPLPKAPSVVAQVVSVAAPASTRKKVPVRHAAAA